MAMVRMPSDLEEGDSVSAPHGRWMMDDGGAIGLGRFENPGRNFSPIGYEERLQMFHLFILLNELQS